MALSGTLTLKATLTRCNLANYWVWGNPTHEQSTRCVYQQQQIVSEVLLSRDLFPVDNRVISNEQFFWPCCTLSTIPLVWKILPLPFLTILIRISLWAFSVSFVGCLSFAYLSHVDDLQRFAVIPLLFSTSYMSTSNLSFALSNNLDFRWSHLG